MVETIVIDSDDSADDDALVKVYGFHLPACQASSGPARHKSCKRPNCPIRVFSAKHSEGHGGIWTPPIAQVTALKTQLKEVTPRFPATLPVGLHNMGATCYINSLLQMIYANVRFRNALLATKWSSPILRQMQRLFARMTLITSATITPIEFVESLNINNEVQQDLHEFNKLLLQHIQSTAAPLTLVEDEYHGQLSYVTECSVCNNVTTRSESFADLQLNLTESLEKSFEELISPEVLQGDNAYSCEVCKAKQIAHRRLRVDRLPPTINLHLVRFIFDRETFRKTKSFTKTRIPKSIDLSNYTCDQSDGPLIYDLIAVLRHQGASADSGHFVADIRSTDNQTWYRFDDHNVRDVIGGLETEESINSSNAYMLVYTSRSSVAAEKRNHSSSKSVIDCELAAEIAEQNGILERKHTRISSELALLEQRIAERKRNVEAVYSPEHCVLPLDSDVEFDEKAVALPIDWLRDWTRNVSESPLDCSPIICPHGRLNPTQSAKMSRISNSSWSIIQSSLSAPISVGPSKQLCRQCVDYCEHLNELRSLLQPSQRELDVEPNAIWISSQYFRALNAALKNSAPLPPVQGMQEGVLCDHGGLSLSRASRSLISNEALTVLTFLLGEGDQTLPAPIGRNAAICIICQENRDRNREERVADSSARKNERGLLKDTIRLGTKRPRSGKYYIAPQEWFACWNDFTLAGTGKSSSPSPGPILTRSLLCEDHGQLLHKLSWPESDGLLSVATDSPLRLIAASEYPFLKSRYSVSGPDILVTFTSRSLELDDSRNQDMECSHGVCFECIHLLQLKTLSYKEGTIYIVEEKDAEKMLRRKRRRQSRSHVLELKVNSTDSVGNVKLRIWERLDVHPSRQTLVNMDFDPLPDSSTLEKCGVARGATLFVRIAETEGDEDIAVDMDSAMDIIKPEHRAGFAGSALESLL